MAKDKVKVTSSLFGSKPKSEPTKLPSDGNNDKGAEASLVDIVTGAIGAIYFGKSNIKPENVKNLFSKNYAIAQNISDIASFYKTFANDKAILNLVDTASNVFAKKLINTLAGDNNFKQFFMLHDDALKIISLLSKSSGSSEPNMSHKTVNNAGIIGDSLMEILDILSKNSNMKNAKSNISELYSVLVGDTKNSQSLANILSKLAEMVSVNNNNFANIQGLANILQSIIGILSDNININVNGLSQISFITSEKGPLAKIFSNLNNINSKYSEKITLDIDSLNDLLSGISTLGKLNVFKMVNAKMSLKFINDVLFTDISSIFDRLVKMTQEVKEPAYASFDILENFFSTISDISDLSLNKKANMLSNIFFVKHFISKSIISLFSEISDAAKNASQDIGSLMAIKDFISSITNIANIDSSSVKDLSFNIKEISSVISIDCASLIKEINSMKPTDNTLIKLDAITQILAVFKSAFEAMPSLREILVGELKLNMIVNSVMKEISEYFDTFSNINGSLFANSFWDTFVTDHILGIVKMNNVLKQNIDKDDLSYLHSLLDELNSFDGIIEAINKIGGNFEASDKSIIAISDFITNLSDTLEPLQSDTSMDAQLTAIGVTSDTLANIKNSLEALEFFEKLSEIINKIGKHGVSKGLDNLLKISKKLSVVFKAFEDLDMPDFKNMNAAIHSLLELVVGCTIVMFVGAIAMSVINVKDLLEFTVILSAFIFALTASISNAADGLQRSLDGLHDLTYLVVITTGVLIAAGLMMHLINIGDLLAFAGTVAVFIAVLTGIFALAQEKNLFKDAISGLRDFAILVVACGLTLAIGAAIYHLINFVDLLLFALTLAGFVWLMTKIFIKAQEKNLFKDAISGLRDFAILVVACGLTLAIGALISKSVNFVDLLMFAGILAGFMAALMLPLIWITKGNSFKMAFKGAMEFGELVAICAATLALGGLLFTLFPQLIPGTVLFTAVLSGFMIALGFSFKLMGNQIEKAIPTAIAMSVLVAICAAALAIGGLAVKKYGADNITKFTADLLVMIGGLTLICALLSKSEGNILKASIVMAVLSGIALLASVAMGYAGNVVQKYGGMAILKGIGLMAACISSLAVIAGILGIPALSIAVGIGEAVIAGLVIIAFGAAKAMEAIGDAMKSLAGVKKFDAKPIIANIRSFIEVGYEVAKIAPIAPFITIAAVSLGALGAMLSKIAEDVQAYSSLQVPIYDGTKITGYRQLSDQDFANAAINVKKIISTLGGAILDTYNQNPEMFIANEGGFLGLGMHTKFETVCISLKSLGEMLYSIASDVKDYASLQIPIYKGTKVVGYRTLVDSDFDNASKNVTTIISTLGNAVVNAYNANPEIFETSGGIFGFGAKSKFSKVTGSLANLGPMISSIARSIQEYASLKVAVSYDSKGNAKEYRALKDTDFKQASENVQIILSTLGGAIIDVYEANPDYYESGMFHNSPFTKTINANMNLGNLIAKIATSVKDYADMKVAVEYDSNGKPKSYRHLDSNDFKAAAANVQIILSTLGDSIINTYSAHPDYYDSKMFTDSPFTQTINANIKLGNLISKIASAVKDYADMKIVEYDANGKPSGFRHLGPDDYRSAAANVQLILSTLGGAIIDLVNNDKDGMFKEGFFGGDSPFVQCVTANMKLGNMIASISKGLKDYADLRIATGYDASGKPVKFREMVNQDFVNAANNIERIITVLGSAIMNSWKHHQDWFEDGEDSIFAQASKSICSMGVMISNIASGVKAYAELKIPIYDKKGQITGYSPIKPTTFTDASNAIMNVINVMGKSIMKVYADHKDWFDDGDDSKMTIVTKSLSNMGNMIGSIATGIKSFATMQIPTKYNEKGEPISYRPLSPQDIANAATNISSILSALGTSIITLYNSDKSMFDIKLDSKGAPIGDSAFARVVSSCVALGNMVSSIANGIKIFASAEIPEFDKNGHKTGNTVSLSSADLNASSKKIGSIITNIGTAILTAFNNHKDWFENPVLQDKEFALSILGGLKYTSKTLPNNGDTPMIKAIKACALMGAMISSIGNGVKMFSSSYVVEYDKKGKKVGVHKLGEADFAAARVQIGKIITYLGKTLNDTYIKNPELFNSPNAVNILKSMSYMGAVVSNIVKSVQSYANLQIPAVKDANGRIIHPARAFTQSDFDNAKTNITSLLVTLASSMNTAYIQNRELFTIDDKTKQSPASIISSSLAKMSSVINRAYTLVSKFANIDMTKLNAGLNNFYVGFTTSWRTIDKIYTTISSMSFGSTKLDKNTFGIDDTKAQFAKLQSFVNIMQSLVNVSEKSASIGKKGYSSMSQGIIEISSSMSQMSNSNMFEQQTNVLDKFVNVVNKVKPNNIDKLNRLASTLNNLAFRMGNLDKLTNVLANKITLELDRLTKQLVAAEKTIKYSEELDKKRKEYIAKSVENIKKIMAQKVVVEVSQVDDNSIAQSPVDWSDNGSSESASSKKPSSGGGGAPHNSGRSGGAPKDEDESTQVKNATITYDGIRHVLHSELQKTPLHNARSKKSK